MADPEYSDLDRFDEVDATGAADRFIAFLELVEGYPDVIARRQRSYALLRIAEGGAVADVGCGIGTAARELAHLGARAIGVDVSKEMVARSRARVSEAAFSVADAIALPFTDAELAGYRAERVYQHLHDPGAALAEAMRVLRPGGRIVLVDQDWDAFLIDGDDPEVTRTILLGFSDSLVNGRVGRQHRRLLVDAGFVDVVVEAETVALADYDYCAPFLPTITEAAVRNGSIDRASVESWLEQLRQRGEEGRFFAAMTHFLVSAMRPSG